MNDEVKEILDNLKHYLIEKKEDYEYGCVDSISIDMYYDEIKIIVDCITNLQQENKRLKEISHKMHLWIFLHSGDEQKVYDELGLTDDENAMLGYSGQFRMGSDKE